VAFLLKSFAVIIHRIHIERRYGRKLQKSVAMKNFYGEFL